MTNTPRPRILVTNDDGVLAPGLLALKQALEPVGEVTIIAPERGWSAAGHTKTMHKPLRLWPTALADGAPAYATNGTPSDCVGLVLLGAVAVRPDLVVSGVNRGGNMGTDITYSGTVAAALEAVVAGLPALAVSLDVYEEGGDFRLAARVGAQMAVEVLERGLPPQTMLNINVPDLPDDMVRGIRVTRLGKRVYRDVLIERTDPRGQPYYWVGGEPPIGVPEEGTDVGALSEGYVSVTPLTLDMTAHAFLDQLATWRLTLESAGS